MQLGGLLYAAISLRKARKRLQRPRRGAFQLYGYSRPLWEPHIVMTPPTAFSTIHPQPDDPSRSATRPHRHGLFARGLKYLRLRPAGPIVAALWIGCLITGSVFLTRYERTPGSDAPAPSQWPSGVSAPRGPNLPTLVMFLHPNCPCSRASIGGSLIYIEKPLVGLHSPGNWGRADSVYSDPRSRRSEEMQCKVRRRKISTIRGELPHAEPTQNNNYASF
jgi:hypothetical protein